MKSKYISIEEAIHMKDQLPYVIKISNGALSRNVLIEKIDYLHFDVLNPQYFVAIYE